MNLIMLMFTVATIIYLPPTFVAVSISGPSSASGR